MRRGGKTRDESGFTPGSLGGEVELRESSRAQELNFKMSLSLESEVAMWSHLSRLVGLKMRHRSLGAADWALQGQLPLSSNAGGLEAGHDGWAGWLPGAPWGPLAGGMSMTFRTVPPKNSGAVPACAFVLLASVTVSICRRSVLSVQHLFLHSVPCRSSAGRIAHHVSPHVPRRADRPG